MYDMRTGKSFTCTECGHGNYIMRDDYYGHYCQRRYWHTSRKTVVEVIIPPLTRETYGDLLRKKGQLTESEIEKAMDWAFPVKAV